MALERSAIFTTLLAVLIAAAAPSHAENGSALSDAAIIRDLGPSSQTNLIVAERSGSARVISRDEVAAVERAAPVPVVAAAMPAHAWTPPVPRSVAMKTPPPRKSSVTFAMSGKTSPSHSSAPRLIAAAKPPASHIRATTKPESAQLAAAPPRAVAPPSTPVLAATHPKPPPQIASITSLPSAVSIAPQVMVASAASAPPESSRARFTPPARTLTNPTVTPEASSPGSAAIPPPEVVAVNSSPNPQAHSRVSAPIEISELEPYVATADVPKPVAAPTLLLVNRHSLQWQYQHRFDTPEPNALADMLVPGIPVRAQVSSPFDIRSGAFHGVRSSNGYSAVRVQVSIPCGVRHFVEGPGFNEVTGQPGQVDQETGYIYIGGWGAGPRGVAVDAGIQKSSAQAIDDEYAFYFKYASNKPITSARFPCDGPDVTMELYPLTDHLLVFSVTGVLESGDRSTITIVQKTDPDDGWVPGGGGSEDGIILKRIVAVAQPDAWRSSVPAGLRRFSSGTYFGVDGVDKRTPRIVWKNCQIGRVSPAQLRPTYKAWTQSETWAPTSSGLYLNWPPADIVLGSGPFCDSVGIALRP